LIAEASDLRSAMRRLEEGKDLNDTEETGRGHREKKRKNSESDHENVKEPVVNIFHQHLLCFTFTLCLKKSM